MTITDQTPRTRLSTRTRRTAAAHDLLDLLPDGSPLAWVRGGEGLVGWGEAARVELDGPGQAVRAAAWWSEVVAGADVVDDVRVPGSGLVCFGSFAFDEAAGTSVLVVPRVVAGHRDGTWFVTEVSGGSDGPVGLAELGDPVDPAGPTGARPVRSPGRVRYEAGRTTPETFERRVADVVARIRRGEVAKVVLARDVVARTSRPVDVRHPLRRLAQRYDDTWTFAVDGLFGATPELLVRLEDGVVTSRVLAGTSARDGHGGGDARRGRVLAASAKEREEHEHAVTSVRQALAPHCTAMDVPASPFVLVLPNVLHLATDVSGVAADGATALGLLEALHPTAAVCGAPRAGALAVLREVEPAPRGRYAGPVGWTDAAGDGEWGIALRCAQVEADDPSAVRLFAGCGIVADSDPAAELAESEAKTAPVREALEG